MHLSPCFATGAGVIPILWTGHFTAPMRLANDHA